MLRYILAIAVLLMIQTIIISGFAPTNTHQQHRVVASFRPANFVQAAMPTSASTPFLVLRMSSEEEGATSKIGADGTFYDDEVDSAPVKQGISDSMKARLIREASTGLDSDSKQTNVLLYIMLGVAVLVVLGGAGVFY